MFGLSLPTFTALHVALSLVAIAAGVIALLRPAMPARASSVATLFLATTLATTLTGLLFALPFPRFGLGHGIGIVSLVVLPPTALALHRHRASGNWRRTYVGGATLLLYLNAFIGVRQAFAKIGFLRDLPATPGGSPLLLAHLLLVMVCLWLALHAAARLQSVAPKPRRRARPLYVVDRWG
ncbi:hypothetical protein [Reyranella sp.]|uniref:hypothetical protein n=1 Tax=Reyranella sp. TaxID=1929291 RepID=UPI003BAB5F6B